MKQSQVKLSRQAMRDLGTVPGYLETKLLHWIDLVEQDGLEVVRKIPGFHDEPLKGARKGQRSIRLNQAYRAFYTVDDSGEIQIVEVIEVNKHKY